MVGQDSILVADYDHSEGLGKWHPYQWADDEYGKWECDELPSR